jgi:hypothetical protein
VIEIKRRPVLVCEGWRALCRQFFLGSDAKVRALKHATENFAGFAIVLVGSDPQTALAVPRIEKLTPIPIYLSRSRG